MDTLIDRLDSPGEPVRLADINTDGEVQLDYTSNFTQDQFEDVVHKCVEYIRAGDIFQVVVSQRLQVPLQAAPFELYRTLRVVNPSPFMFYLRTPDVTLVGSSPEILVRVVDGHVTVRPLAGTRRRGDTEQEDQRLAEELLADPKERAEHVMLVDLGRNDVGRVAQYGSVELSDVMVIERYSHVMHITSNVTGQLQRVWMRSTPWQPACPRAPFPALPRCGQWKSSTRWNLIVGARTPARLATSTSPATWTPASHYAQSSSKKGPPISKPARALWPTA